MNLAAGIKKRKQNRKYIGGKLIQLARRKLMRCAMIAVLVQNEQIVACLRDTEKKRKRNQQREDLEWRLIQLARRLLMRCAMVAMLVQNEQLVDFLRYT